jgi:hypothetical protein
MSWIRIREHFVLVRGSPKTFNPSKVDLGTLTSDHSTAQAY